MPLPAKPLTLTVNPDGRVYLSRELCIHLSLTHGQAIELLPPNMRRLRRWHLMLPAAGTPHALLTLYVKSRDGKSYKPQFRSRQVLSPTRFKHPETGELLPRLTLVLSEQSEQTPGYHVLTPVYGPPTRMPTLETVVAAYESGLSLRKVAKLLGVSRPSIRLILKKNKYPLRDVSQPS